MVLAKLSVGTCGQAALVLADDAAQNVEADDGPAGDHRSWARDQLGDL